MRVTLDFDEPRLMSEEDRLNFIKDKAEELKAKFPTAKISYYVSSNKGVHIVISGLKISIEDSFKIREKLGDDKVRLSLDKARYGIGSPFINVLFTSKRNYRKEVKTTEV